MLNVLFIDSEEQGSREFVFRPYVRRNGKTIYPKTAKVLRFPSRRK